MTAGVMHRCPAGCGRMVRKNLYACREDWFRLPFTIRAEISGAYRTNPERHMRAMHAAQQWYRDNPRAKSTPTVEGT